MTKKSKNIPSSKPDAERMLRQADRLARIMRASPGTSKMMLAGKCYARQIEIATNRWSLKLP